MKHALLLFAAALALTACQESRIPPAQPLPDVRTIAEGPFEATWESLAANYECPEWFRDAKLGIWAHWGPQCVPGEGDWYARSMYMQGHKQYDAHVAKYGHPADSGYMEVIRRWTAERWEPDSLMALYKAAGARYFVAMANHVDNFDAYDSKYHAWNSVNVGPKRDVIGTWARVARENGLRFGVSNHSSHTWHWLQTAHGYDAEGPRAGERYDAYRLTAADGKGKWWDGLDPQDLYGKPREGMTPPDGIPNADSLRNWHDEHNLPWTEAAPEDDPEYVDRWFFRLQDLMDSYRPDFVYLDNTGDLPLGQAGLDIVAHYYNSNMACNGGKLEAVLTAKGLRGEKARAVTLDYERSASEEISPEPFETGTCIGEWHYKKGIEYKSVRQVVQLLVDVVSKNGTLLLSIPQRGDGSIDERELAFLQGFATWSQVNGEGIFGSRPWHVYGEGPTRVGRGRARDAAIPYTQDDVRFTTKDGYLYAYVLALPERQITITSLANGAEFARPVASVELVGSDEPLRWEQTAEGLVIQKPETMSGENVAAFKVAFS
jgi:alpha-L-fucosidase